MIHIGKEKTMIHYDAKQFIKTLWWPCYTENCGFLLGEHVGEDWVVRTVVRTPNITHRDPTVAYAIGASAWEDVSATQAVIGHAHTHICGPSRPSMLDLRYIRRRELGAILHLPTGTITFYTKDGVIATRRHKMPPIMNLIVHVVGY